MISVAEALEQLFALAEPLGSEEVPLARANGRVLTAPVTALRDQPPFPASAMDGYAVIGDEVRPGARFTVTGEAAAGRAFAGTVAPGEAVRIFTGAPVPPGATRVVIQEDVTREGATITLSDRLDSATHIRGAGIDFTRGQTIPAPRRLRPAEIALAASMNAGSLTVARRPRVALISTGDELVLPGDRPGPDQIVASNTFGLAALLEANGAEARILPIARDTVESLTTTFDLAMDADLIVTIGGASVGDHDLVGPVARDLGMEQSFYKVAMRPGKPLMAGRLRGVPMIGLPGNPVSAMVCGHVFLLPVIDAMQGLPAMPRPLLETTLAADIGANGPRAHYMRARLTPEGITPFESQDSALLSILGAADALLVRPPQAPAAKAGTTVSYLPL